MAARDKVRSTSALPTPSPVPPPRVSGSSSPPRGTVPPPPPPPESPPPLPRPVSAPTTSVVGQSSVSNAFSLMSDILPQYARSGVGAGSQPRLPPPTPVPTTGATVYPSGVYGTQGYSGYQWPGYLGGAHSVFPPSSFPPAGLPSGLGHYATGNMAPSAANFMRGDGAAAVAQHTGGGQQSGSFAPLPASNPLMVRSAMAQRGRQVPVDPAVVQGDRRSAAFSADSAGHAALSAYNSLSFPYPHYQTPGPPSFAGAQPLGAATPSALAAHSAGQLLSSAALSAEQIGALAQLAQALPSLGTTTQVHVDGGERSLPPSNVSGPPPSSEAGRGATPARAHSSCQSKRQTQSAHAGAEIGSQDARRGSGRPVPLPPTPALPSAEPLSPDQSDSSEDDDEFEAYSPSDPTGPREAAIAPLPVINEHADGGVPDPSFAEALELLSQVCPDSVGKTAAKTTSSSETSSQLGLKVVQQGEPVLLESRIISTTLEALSSQIAGEKTSKPCTVTSADLAPSADHPPQPGFLAMLPQGVEPRPNAMAKSAYIQPPRQTYPTSAKFQLSALPPSQTVLGATDKRLVKGGQVSTSVVLSDATAKHLEEEARRALHSVSVMDRFLAGLLGHVRDPDSALGEFNLRDEIDTVAVQAMASQCCNALNDIASQVGALYANAILLRRDMLLSSPKLSISDDTAVRSIRAVPLGGPGLFGQGEAQASLNAEAQKKTLDKLLDPTPRYPTPRGTRGGQSKLPRRKRRKQGGFEKPDGSRFQSSSSKPSGSGGQAKPIKRQHDGNSGKSDAPAPYKKGKHGRQSN